MKRRPLSWRILGIVGLVVLAIPTALFLSASASILYEHWLWDVPVPQPGGHGELTPTRATAIEGLWLSLALVALWLAVWWLLFVRQVGTPLWANHKALKVLAAFAIFIGAVTAWVMTTLSGRGPF